MGRLTYMSGNRSRRWHIAAAICSVLLVSSCSFESLVTVTDRPLAEQLDERGRSDLVREETSEPENTVGPVSLAFREALEPGDLLRLQVTDEANAADLRSGPGPAYDLVSEVPSGVEVLGTGNRTGEWVHVQYGDFEGWVRARRVSLASTAEQDQVIQADDVDRTPVRYVVVGEAIGVNIRSEPNAVSDLVGGAPVGSHVVGTGSTEGSWIEITFEGVTGWSSGNYLEPVNRDVSSPRPDDGDPVAAPSN